MSEKAILPSADQIVGPALDKFYTLRPTAFPHINLRQGIYWHPFLAQRAQAATMLKRLSDLVGANRLSTAEGQDLLEYVASEYETVTTKGRTFAFGEVTFFRTETTLIGDIPKGTRINRTANLASRIPYQAAAYETQVDVHFDVGQSTAGPVPIKAVSDGTGSNHPISVFVVPHGVTITGVFDPTITVLTFGAAGGSDGADDEFIRRYAKAFSSGQYGPNVAASKYGALRSSGIRNLLVYDLPGTGTERILVADSTWASSDRWAQSVQQSLYDNDLVGFGCRVEVRKVRNATISVECSVTLRDINFMIETTEIDKAIQKAARSYFDDRGDWNIFKLKGLRAAISRAHNKILHCSSVTVKDNVGTPLAEISSPDYNLEQLHYYLANNAVTITYTGPS